MHLVKAYVMPHYTVTLQNCVIKSWQYHINWLVQHFESFIHSARCSAIWWQKKKLPTALLVPDIDV